MLLTKIRHKNPSTITKSCVPKAVAPAIRAVWNKSINSSLSTLKIHSPCIFAFQLGRETRRLACTLKEQTVSEMQVNESAIDMAASSTSSHLSTRLGESTSADHATASRDFHDLSPRIVYSVNQVNLRNRAARETPETACRH